MPTDYSLSDTIITTLNAQEPWPNDVKLFQPYEVEQILLPDNASCLAVQAFLKMCNLPFEVEMRWNAEFMSPSGRVPFIKCGAFVVSELEPIVQFAANKGVTLCSGLSTEEKAEMRAYMSLITNVLVNAELYISWLDPETFNSVTRVRNSSVYPWPLGWLQTRAKRNNVAKRLKALHWHDKTLDQVLADVEQCCNSLSQRLGDKEYFFGTPTPLDALVHGHMRALLSAVGPKAAKLIKPITSPLLRHTIKMVNLTKMTLTPQEEYLINQAFQVSNRSERIERATFARGTLKRSRMQAKRIKEALAGNDTSMFGFKPFASKQIIIMTSKEGRIICEHLKTKQREANVDFVNEIVDYIIDKVADDFGDLNKIVDTNLDSNDFVIISRKEYEHLRIDDDNIGDGDVINDEGSRNDQYDGDSVKDDKLITSEIDLSTSVTLDSSIKAEIYENGSKNSSGDGVSMRNSNMNVSKSTNFTNRTSFSSGSKSTLKSSEEITVENLLKCLLRRNEEYYTVDIAEVD